MGPRDIDRPIKGPSKTVVGEEEEDILEGGTSVSGAMTGGSFKDLTLLGLNRLDELVGLGRPGASSHWNGTETMGWNGGVTSGSGGGLCLGSLERESLSGVMLESSCSMKLIILAESSLQHTIFLLINRLKLN